MFNLNKENYWVDGLSANEKIKDIISDIIFITTGVIVYGGSIAILIYLAFTI